MLKMYGVTRHQALGCTIEDLSGPENNMEDVRKMWMRVVTGEDQFFSWQARRPTDGSLFDVEVFLTRVTSGGKQIILANVRDISESKKAKERLILFKESLENSTDAIGISTPEGHHYYQNKMFTEVFGTIGDYPPDSIYVDKKVGEEIFSTIMSGQQWIGEIQLFAKDGKVRDFLLRAYANKDDDGKITALLGIHTDITARKRTEAALEKRIIALTQPLESIEDIAFEDLFNVEDLQKLQDEFAVATGVASIITRPDGVPITKPSNFTYLCNDIIRKTEIGCANCYKSDAVIGKLSHSGPIVQPCKSGGLWDAGAGISVGGKPVANWLIGQVRDETQTEEKMIEYATQIGVDKDAFLEAFRQVPAMSKNKFSKIAQMLFTLATQLSRSAYQNVQQARFITESKNAQEELRQREREYRLTVDGLLIGVVVHDKDSRILISNPEASNILGLTADQLFGKEVVDPIWTFVYEDLSSMEVKDYPVAKVISTKKPLKDYVLGMRCSERDYITWVNVNASPVFFTDGELDKVVVNFIDITESKKVEEELRRYREELEVLIDERTKELKRSQKQLLQAEKLASIGELSAGVAHELNSPLMGVLVFIDTFLDGINEKNPEYDDLICMKEACTHMATIIKNLNNFATKAKNILVELNCNEIVETTFSFSLGLLKKANIVIQRDYEENLYLIFSDKNQIQQVILNMITNARDAMSEGGTLKIETRNKIRDNKKFVQMVFSDTGHGMDKKVVSRIFDPFFTTKRPGRGVGLGLSIVYNIISNFDGTIKVNSLPKQGTSFIIELPALEK